MKRMLQSYFGFTKKELNGILVLCILIMLILLFPWVHSRYTKPEVHNFDNFDLEMKEFLATAQVKTPESYDKVRDDIEDAELKASYFYFDPNGLEESAWRKLGLSARQIKVIKNYESKGGRFYKKEDLKRMYSISDRKYQQLEPYIRIASGRKQAKVYAKSYFENNSKKTYPSKTESLKVVELNTADSTQLETLRGIGPAFSARIVKYRTRLGGFYKKEQLLDVYGLDSAKFEEFKNSVTVDPSIIQKINVNTATFDEIKKHPYLSYKQMNALIQYRYQHGVYRSIEDLSKIAIINEEILRKIEPYLTY